MKKHHRREAIRLLAERLDEPRDAGSLAAEPLDLVLPIVGAVVERLGKGVEGVEIPLLLHREPPNGQAALLPGPLRELVPPRHVVPGTGGEHRDPVGFGETLAHRPGEALGAPGDVGAEALDDEGDLGAWAHSEST